MDDILDLCKTNVPLSRFSTMKIGGNARYMLQTSNEKTIIDAIVFCKEKSIPYFIIGGGSNCVFDDEGYNGMIIKITGGIYTLEETKKGTVVAFPAGYSAHLASQKMIDEKLSGFESLFGLPGTIGGAIVMNSKWPKSNFSIGDVFVDGIYVTSEGEKKVVKNDDLHFSYGHSSLQNEHGILLSARFLLQKSTTDEIQSKCEQVMKYRKVTQPTGVFTAGCVFKNPGTTSAGYLIDQCQLKGYSIGGMTISTVHANFFVNNGTATSSDFDTLVQYVQSEVLRKFNIQLEMEVLRIHYT